jgi:hypothetical protein
MVLSIHTKQKSKATMVKSAPHTNSNAATSVGNSCTDEKGGKAALFDSSSSSTMTGHSLPSIDGIEFVDYVDERQLEDVMRLVGQDLSEPYSGERRSPIFHSIHLRLLNNDIDI